MKVLSKIIYALSILGFLWLFISWIDIIADNCTPNPHHYVWNFFMVLSYIIK